LLKALDGVAEFVNRCRYLVERSALGGGHSTEILQAEQVSRVGISPNGPWPLVSESPIAVGEDHEASVEVPQQLLARRREDDGE